MKKSRGLMCVVLLLVLCSLVALAACTGPQTVKPYAVVKATAEEILFDARVLQNKGQITDVQFETINTYYNKVKDALDVAIDARLALIAVNSVENQNKVTVATVKAIQLLSEFQALAVQFGIKGVK